MSCEKKFTIRQVFLNSQLIIYNSQHIALHIRFVLLSKCLTTAGVFFDIFAKYNFYLKKNCFKRFHRALFKVIIDKKYNNSQIFAKKYTSHNSLKTLFQNKFSTFSLKKKK